MPRLPDKTALGSPGSFRSGRAIVQAGEVDQSAIGRGLASLGSGIAKAGADFKALQEKEQSEQDALDLIKADVLHKKGLFETDRQFSEDPDYKTYDQRFQSSAGAVTNRAASVIRNPELREKWALKAQNDNLRTREGILKRGDTLRRQERVVEIETALDQYRNIYTDPGASPDKRADALQQIETSIELATRSGLVDPKGAEKLRNDYYRGAIKDEIERRLIDDPEGLRRDLLGRDEPLPDTDLNPELRAKPKTVQPRREVSQFTKDVNEALNMAARETGLDPQLLSTFVKIESGGNPRLVSSGGKGSYKGLLQLSESEFGKYGGGDIFNPADNAVSGARKLKEEAARFARKHGREPTALDLYLVHQQGEAGYAAHLSNPDETAWRNIRRFYKSERMAKKAVWDNVPSDVKGRYGSVDNITSADFIELWQGKVDRLGGGSAAAGDGTQPKGPYAQLSPLERAKYVQDAETKIRTSLNSQIEEMHQALDDDVRSIRETGVSTEPPVDIAQRVVTPNRFNKYRLDRQESIMEFNALDGIEALPEEDLQERLNVLEPAPGEELYEMKAKVFAKAMTRADKLRDLREKDPARSVSDLPDVQVAEQGVRENPGDPQFVQQLASARIEAQREVGIPEGLQSPITRQEARVILSPTRGLEGDALYKSLEEAQAKFEEQYGPYARIAAAKAFEYDGRSKETAEELAGFVDGLFKGEKISASQIRRLEFLNETDLATRAFGGDFTVDPFRQYQGRPEGEDQGAPMSAASPGPAITSGMRRPPRRAIEFLLANPALAPQFNAKYGPGSAESVLSTQGIQ